jgi:chitin disaccharide deacetylase
MPTRLILNADDFGLTRGVNRAIAELHAAGALTSATLMANGPAFDDAIAVAHAHPTLGVGCHIVLTDGTPISPPEKIPSLLGPDHINFRSSLSDFLIAVFRSQINEAEVLREALAQIERLQQHGIVITHLDTHKHTHILPSIARPLLVAAEHTGVRAVRNPFEQPWSLALGKSSLLRRLQLRITQSLRPRFLALPQIRNGLVATTDGTIGMSATGNLNAATLTAILSGMPDGLWEIVCHPGYNDRDLDAITTRLRSTRDIERSALLEAFSKTSQSLMHPSRTRLINYSSIFIETRRSAVEM